ncbi:VWA domain-containing protein [Prosthecobacter sp.]|jgi:secreted protein with Ig-like and vWFA domain|uniref:vWA domain-containing protein n=1 Tax=Prosthecobacter sp. TaxID=1965333 RepID=UPI0025F5F946|nr:VWA domain-containing protein [Prosthecobacter sp.]
MKPEQITAWALDEASAEERERLEAELRDDPKAKQTAEETKDFCHFLLAELRDDSLAFTDEQRERLKAQPMAQASTMSQSSVTGVSRSKWRTGIAVRLAIAASWVAMGGFWTWYLSDGASKQLLAINEPRYSVSYHGVGSYTDPNALPMTGLPGGIPVGVSTPGSLPGLPSLPPWYPDKPSLLTRDSGLSTMTTGDVAELGKLQDQRAYHLSVSGSGKASPASQSLAAGRVIAGTELSLTKANGDVPPPDPLQAPTSAMIFLGSAPAAPASAPMVLNPQPAEPVAKGLILAGSSAELGNYDMAIGQYQDVLRADPYNAAARRGLESVEKKRMEYFKTAADSSRSKMLAQVDEKWEEKVPKSDAYYLEKDLAANREGGVRLQLEARSDAESYTRILENELKDVAREPLSTFSIDVDTASYANVRRFLNQNTIPPADAVRIEELINYFPTAEEGPAPTAKEPFAVRVEMAPCPWQPAHRLARIAIKGRELGNERRNSNLVFLVDVSGSMNEPNKLPLVQQSLRMLTEQLGEEDRVTMVVYAGSSGLVLPPTSGDKKSEIIAAIDKLQAGGSTHGSAGIQLAYEQAVAGFIKEGVNRVILCTDGDFNVGVSSPEELEKLITRKAKSGVFLSVLGFGTGNLKDRTMETLADKGNGNYAYIDSLSEARKVLVEQMSGTLVTIAKDVKIQVEFNPAAVRSYRLIGYENRLMAKEDFNDDTKDAGEIGAGHSVVALYEVVPANLPPGAEPRPAVDSLKYQTPAIAPAQLAEAAKNGETMTVKLRYKAPDSDLSKLIEMPVKDEGKTLTASSEEYKFSAAVAGFGLLLRDSAYKGSLGWETVRRLALDGKGADKLGYRGEFLQLIDKARGLKETRP